MKVVSNSADLLVLRYRSRALSATLVMMLAFLGLFITLALLADMGWYTLLAFCPVPPLLIALFFSAEAVLVVFDRPGGHVTIKSRNYRGKSSVTHPLTEIDHAIVQYDDVDDDAESAGERTAIVLSSGMDAGTHPLSENYLVGLKARNAARAINAWLSHAVDSVPRTT